MTAQQAIDLKRGDIVIMDGDESDWGTVLFSNGEVVKVEWEEYKGDPSLHRVDQMERIGRGARRG